MMNDIQTFMAEQFDPKRFVVRTFRVLVRHETKNLDPLDEALQTKFICSVVKLKDDELKFSNAIRVAQEMEEAVKVAKETVHGQPSTSVHYHPKSKTSKTQEKKTACFRCGNSGHFSKACPHTAICMHASTKQSPMFCFIHLSKYYT